MKSIAIVGTQVFLAAAIIATGATVLVGSDLMAQRFAVVGLGEFGRLAIGVTEILAGLCLLLPRGQAAGAAMLAVLTIAVLGVTVGQVAAGGNSRLAAAKRAPQVFSAVAGACDLAPAAPLRLAAPKDWAI